MSIFFSGCLRGKEKHVKLGGYTFYSDPNCLFGLGFSFGTHSSQNFLLITTSKGAMTTASENGHAATTTEKKTRPKKQKSDTYEDGCPRPPPSNYMLFMKSRYPAIMSESPSASFGDRGKSTGKAWKALSAEEK